MTFLAPQAIVASRRYEKPRENKLLCASIIKKSYLRNVRNKSKRYKKISGFRAAGHANQSSLCKFCTAIISPIRKIPVIRSCNDVEETKRISFSSENICAFPNILKYTSNIKLLPTSYLRNCRMIVPADSWNVRRAIAPVNVYQCVVT